MIPTPGQNRTALGLNARFPSRYPLWNLIMEMALPDLDRMESASHARGLEGKGCVGFVPAVAFEQADGNIFVGKAEIQQTPKISLGLILNVLDRSENSDAWKRSVQFFPTLQEMWKRHAGQSMVFRWNLKIV